MLVAAMAAGCKTAENSLRREDVASFKLTGVTVRYKPDASIMWEDAVRAYATAQGIPDHQLAEASASPQAKAYAQKFLADRAKATLERNLAPKLAGTRPVRLEVVVLNFTVASAVQRIIIGGTHMMIADAVLVDARTNATIVSYPGLAASAAAGQGVLGTAVTAAIEAGQGVTAADRILINYADSYSGWLIKA
jgi:hypothetical protein